MFIPARGRVIADLGRRGEQARTFAEQATDQHEDKEFKEKDDLRRGLRAVLGKRRACAEHQDGCAPKVGAKSF